MKTFTEFFEKFLVEKAGNIVVPKSAIGEKAIPKVESGTDLPGSDGFDQEHVRGAIGDPKADKVEDGTDLKGSDAPDPVKDSDDKAIGQKKGECLKEGVTVLNGDKGTVIRANFKVL